MIADAVLEVTGGPVGHHDAWLGEEEAAAVASCLRDIANHKPINDLERALEAACDVRHAVATSSGSAALELALSAVGVGHGDAVIVPALSFVAAANAVVHLGATPVFIDARRSHFGLCPDHLSRFIEQETFTYHRRGPTILRRTRQRLAAVIAVHVIGQPCDIENLCAIASDHGIPLIEDAAEALGSFVRDVPLPPFSLIKGNRPCGSYGYASILSFNYNKIVTGTGGAVLTEDDDLAILVRRLATTARVHHPWEVAHDAVAWNFRMPTMCAAVIGAQLAKLPHFLRCKRALASAYERVLDGFDLMFHAEHPGITSNRWLVPIITRNREQRDAVLTALHGRGLMARALFTPLHMLAPYRDSTRGGDLSCAEDLWARTVCLPSGAKLGEKFL
jgi:perosamine synthetase